MAKEHIPDLAVGIRDQQVGQCQTFSADVEDRIKIDVFSRCLILQGRIARGINGTGEQFRRW
jgi:hypothetical protein